jgi:hypothetical protein
VSLLFNFCLTGYELFRTAGGHADFEQYTGRIGVPMYPIATLVITNGTQLGTRLGHQLTFIFFGFGKNGLERFGSFDTRREAQISWLGKSTTKALTVL